MSLMRSFAKITIGSVFTLMLAALTPTVATARTHRDKSAAPYRLKKVHRRAHPHARYTMMDEEAVNAPR